MSIRLFCALCLALPLPVLADASFDRPGIAFSTSTLDRDELVWEQGVPDYTRSKVDGGHSDSYNADTLLRTGLTKGIEAQFGIAPVNVQRTVASGQRDSASGLGDTTLGVKAALPLSSSRVSAAVLGSVSRPTGSNAFSAQAGEYQLGATVILALNEKTGLGLYGNLDHVAGSATAENLAPSLSYSVSDRLGVFAEAGLTRQPHQPNDLVAGGGVTWMATPAMQLDAFLDHGLTSRSTQVSAGLGVSLYFH